jgi:hypothetical protein
MNKPRRARPRGVCFIPTCAHTRCLYVLAAESVRWRSTSFVGSIFEVTKCLHTLRLIYIECHSTIKQTRILLLLFLYRSRAQPHEGVNIIIMYAYTYIITELFMRQHHYILHVCNAKMRANRMSGVWSAFL